MTNIYNSIQNLYNMDKETWQEVLSEMYTLVNNTSLKFDTFEQKFLLHLGNEVTKELKKMYNDGRLGDLINDVLLKDINTKVDTFKTEVREQLDTTATNEWCKGGFWNVCHKGGVLCCSPQNSLEGIEKAYEFGYKAIEVDIGITVDGKWICFHDETVDFLTDGTGNYYEKTWEEIQRLNYDAGTGGNNTLLNTFYFPVKIPLFEDFLKKANEYNMCVALDVRGFTTYTEENIKDLIDIIKKYDMEKKVVIWGVDFSTVRKYSYHIAISFSSTTQTAETIYNTLKPFLPNVMNNRIDVYYTKENISELHQYGIKCAVGFPGNGENDANDIVDKWRDEYGMDYLIVDNYLYNEGGIK